MTTFTTDDRKAVQEMDKEPIPFAGHADLSKPDQEVWHFSLNAENGETTIEVKKTWEF